MCLQTTWGCHQHCLGNQSDNQNDPQCLLTYMLACTNCDHSVAVPSSLCLLAGFSANGTKSTSFFCYFPMWLLLFFGSRRSTCWVNLLAYLILTQHCVTLAGKWFVNVSKNVVTSLSCPFVTLTNWLHDYWMVLPIVHNCSVGVCQTCSLSMKSATTLFPRAKLTFHLHLVLKCDLSLEKLSG